MNKTGNFFQAEAFGTKFVVLFQVDGCFFVFQVG
jgi:hypothetical protein